MCHELSMVDVLQVWQCICMFTCYPYLKAAYMQCPLSGSNINLCITLVFNLVAKQIDYHELYGTSGSNLLSPSPLDVQGCKELLSLVVDHFFDYFWTIEPQCLAEYATGAFSPL